MDRDTLKEIPFTGLNKGIKALAPDEAACLYAENLAFDLDDAFQVRPGNIKIGNSNGEKGLGILSYCNCSYPDGSGNQVPEQFILVRAVLKDGQAVVEWLDEPHNVWIQIITLATVNPVGLAQVGCNLFIGTKESTLQYYNFVTRTITNVIGTNIHGNVLFYPKSSLLGSRLFVAGSAANPSSVYWSQLNNPTDFSLISDGELSGGVYQMDLSTCDDIRGFGEKDGEAIIFADKENSTAQFINQTSGSLTNAIFQVSPVRSGEGAAFKDAICYGQNDTIIYIDYSRGTPQLHYYGLFKGNFFTLAENRSNDIDRLLRYTDPSAACIVQYRNRVYFSLKENGSSFNNVEYVYLPETGAFARNKVNVGAYAIHNKQLYWVASNEGAVYKQELCEMTEGSSPTAKGTGIVLPSFFQSGIMNMGTVSPKKLTVMYICGYAKSGVKIDVDFVFDSKDKVRKTIDFTKANPHESSTNEDAFDTTGTNVCGAFRFQKAIQLDQPFIEMSFRIGSDAGFYKITKIRFKAGKLGGQGAYTDDIIVV